jgi:hypothetical protein
MKRLLATTFALIGLAFATGAMAATPSAAAPEAVPAVESSGDMMLEESPDVTPPGYPICPPFYYRYCVYTIDGVCEEWGCKKIGPV